MKKIIGILLTAVLVFMGGVFTVSAQDTAGEEEKIFKINIDNICTFLWAGEKPEFSIELDPEILDKVNVDSEKWIGPNELTIGGDNIAIKGGKYRYELKLSAKEGFVFDNDLEINYQGIDGIYKLNYSFPPGDDSNHTMIVTGDFDNIIAASPLIDRIDVGQLLVLMITGHPVQAVEFLLDDGIPFSKKASVDEINSRISHISDDKYSYELVLKTKEGFSFSNTLQFLYDEKKYGYSLDYNYDLSTDKHTLKIRGIADKKQTEPAKPEADGSDLMPGASALAADKAIVNMANDSDPKGTVFSKLRLRSTSQTKNTIRLSWKKQSAAKVYVIYGNKCGSSNKPKRLAVSTGNAVTIKSIGSAKLRKGTYYKFIIVAIDKDAKVVSTSKLIHVAAKGSKEGNHKSVTISKSVAAKAKKLKKGKTLKLNARTVAQSKKLRVKKHTGLRYESTNNNIATVSRSGKITAKAKGVCYIYAYAQDGVYRKIKVKVK